MTYCSVACCRKHKSELCGKSGSNDDEKNEYETTSPHHGMQKQTSKYVSDVAQLTPKQDEKKEENGPHTHWEDLEEGWRMTSDMVEAMESSAWLKEELSDPGLQRLISRIAEASDAVVAGRGRDETTQQERVLEQIQSDNPQFKQFIDKLLVLTGVLEREESDTVNLEEWLRGGDNSTHLVLKGLERRRRSGDEEKSSSVSSDDDDSSSSSNEDSSRSDSSSSSESEEGGDDN
jgi:hypothetical protein